MKDNLIKVHQDFTKINLGIFTEKELELFYYICLNVKNINNNTIELDFSFMKKDLELANFRDLKKYIVGLHQKLGKLHITTITPKRIETIFLFDKFINDLENNTLTVKVTESSLYFFNNANSYLRFLFSDVRKLSGKYSKLLVPYLMEYPNTIKKEAIFEKNRFFEILEVEEKYKKRLDNFNNKILKPAVEELNLLFKNLKYSTIKNGRIIKFYKFTWTNDFNFQNKDIKEAEIIEICEIEQYWLDNFPGVNYTSKHKAIIEKMKEKDSISYIKNYLMEQWNYVKNNNDIDNKIAYFSSLILGEKAVLKDYISDKKINDKEDKLQADNFIKELEEKTNTTRQDIELEQTSLFITEITKEEYKKIYQEYLKNNNLEDNDISKKVFDISNKNKYKIIEKKIYTVDDIDPNLLLSKNGKKLFGGALQTRINKILDEMNQ